MARFEKHIPYVKLKPIYRFIQHYLRWIQRSTCGTVTWVLQNWWGQQRSESCLGWSQSLERLFLWSGMSGLMSMLRPWPACFAPVHGAEAHPVWNPEQRWQVYRRFDLTICNCQAFIAYLSSCFLWLSLCFGQNSQLGRRKCKRKHTPSFPPLWLE